MNEIKCRICNRTPAEISYYVDQSESESCQPDDIIKEDRTYDSETGEFTCIVCVANRYSANMPLEEQIDWEDLFNEKKHN